MKLDSQELQSLDRYWIHHCHPDGRLVAAEVPRLEIGCAVWDSQTGELVWKPGAGSIAWSSDGRRVALLTDDYNERFELRTWPEGDRVSHCKVKPGACCNQRVALSPRDDLAAVLWWHQTEGGVELVRLENGKARQLEEQGYMTRGTNLLEGPVFNAAGDLVVITESAWAWWSGAEGDPETPSPGGRFEAGRVAIFDIAKQTCRYASIEIDVPAGWMPEDTIQELIGPPEFTGTTEVVVRAPVGPDHRFDVVKDVAWAGPATGG